jgi:hypothetical protein
MFYHFFIVKDTALLVLFGHGIKPTESLVSTAPCFGGKAHWIRGKGQASREVRIKEEKKLVKSLVFWVSNLEFVKNGCPVCRYLERHFFTVTAGSCFCALYPTH